MQTKPVQFLLWLGGGLLAGGLLDAAESPRSVAPDGLNLPAHYRQLIADRAIIDRYQLRRHQVEPAAEPAPLQPAPKPGAPRPAVRVVVPRLDPATLAYRAGFPDRFLPLRGFRAPILEAATNQPPPVLFEERLSPEELKAATLVHRQLAFDGLLSTLAQTVAVMGPQAVLTNLSGAMASLVAVGFPTDLLPAFPLADVTAAPPVASEWVVHVARRLAEGTPLETLQADLRARPLKVPAAWTGFRVAGESGETRLELLRLQFGGGYRDGIVPGDSLDVIGQLLRLLPDREFIVTMPREYSAPFQSLALRAWGVAERTHVTVVEEPFAVTAWAQDSGKAGYVVDTASGAVRRATLAPRYASRDEGISSCLAGESFLMDGLAAAGEKVLQFPLLFQGGNVRCVPVPETRERVLLLSESDVLRNLALGLTRDQVLELFRQGLGVDRCLVLPAVSYHLDFDLSVRTVAGRPVVFVNDPLAAARLILQLGVEAMKGDGLFPEGRVGEILTDLRSGTGELAYESIRQTLADQLRAGSRYPAALARRFVRAPVDSAAGNLQCFLQALDLLAVSLGDRGDGGDPERARFLAALRRIDDARQAQLAALRATGWRVVSVPSMPNLLRSINYLNAVHDPEAVLMPAFGGFYSPLDARAVAAFEEVVGPVAVKPIQCAELQRYFGGVRCAVAGYPEPPPAPDKNR